MSTLSLTHALQSSWNSPPYAQQLQAALQRPLYDLTTLAAMMANVVHRQAVPSFI
ncbi:hypothetical protein [Pseudophaeobacter sp.]|uniref:hypothetical protein n=1 Tax=Pseudophaeobacter sp. TaxID=1971739 RepID=UPI002601A33D|nr:hypothetical protein [Pseudophaeobacter sp.]